MAITLDHCVLPCMNGRQCSGSRMISAISLIVLLCRWCHEWYSETTSSYTRIQIQIQIQIQIRISTSMQVSNKFKYHKKWRILKMDRSHVRTYLIYFHCQSFFLQLVCLSVELGSILLFLQCTHTI